MFDELSKTSTSRKDGTVPSVHPEVSIVTKTPTFGLMKSRDPVTAMCCGGGILSADEHGA